jgi:hypothetical protein
MSGKPGMWPRTQNSSGVTSLYPTQMPRAGAADFFDVRHDVVHVEL